MRHRPALSLVETLLSLALLAAMTAPTLLLTRNLTERSASSAHVSTWDSAAARVGEIIQRDLDAWDVRLGGEEPKAEGRVSDRNASLTISTRSIGGVSERAVYELDGSRLVRRSAIPDDDESHARVLIGEVEVLEFRSSITERRLIIRLQSTAGRSFERRFPLPPSDAADEGDRGGAR